MGEYLSLNRIDFPITYLCNSNCIHCYAPKYRKNTPKHIEPSKAIDFMRRVSANFNLETIMIWGGEPLLFPDVVYSINAQAKKLGVTNRVIITNGYWSKDKKKNKNYCEKPCEK